MPNWIEAPAQPATTKGAFFWVKHEFKSPDSIEAFWNQMATLGETEMKGMLEKNNKLHMHNHTFSPTNKYGPLFCCWESENDISVEEFQAFIDGPDSRSQPSRQPCSQVRSRHRPQAVREVSGVHPRHPGSQEGCVHRCSHRHQSHGCVI